MKMLWNFSNNNGKRNFEQGIQRDEQRLVNRACASARLVIDDITDGQRSFGVAEHAPCIKCI